MAKLKWAEIARSCSPIRYGVLKKLMEKNSIENDIELFEVEPSEFEGKIGEALEEFSALRIGSPYGQLLPPLFQGQKAELVKLKAADAIVKVGNRWELFSCNLVGMNRIIQDYGKSFDRNASILVVGAGAGARVAVASFIKHGINNIKITNKFREQALELIEDLKRLYFGINFEFVPEEQLVSLPGVNSVLINTTPLVPSNDILKELYYFNFLDSEGLVIDFTVNPIDTPLVTAAEQIGIQTIRGFEVSSWGDIFWVEKCLNIHLDRKSYCEMLKEEIGKQEFDMSPFLHDQA